MLLRIPLRFDASPEAVVDAAVVCSLMHIYPDFLFSEIC
jgi:hypothetical protein